MTCALDDELKQALDVAEATVSSIGLRPYTVSLVRVYTTGSRPGVGTKNVVSSSLKVGPGYTGNPRLEQVSSREIFLSNGTFTDQHYKLGPLVPLYSGSCGSGGTNSSIFRVDTNASQGVTQQLYLKVEGPNMHASGSFFAIVRNQEDSSLSYYVYAKHTGERVA